MEGKETDMRRSIPLLFLALVLCFSVPALAQKDVNTLIKKMQEKYAHLNGASASYTREVITRTMSMMGGQVSGDLATGLLFFQSPHYMRMEQKVPDHEILITNGDTLWWYLPDKKTVYKYPAEKFGKELTLLSDIFHGLEKVEKRFHIVLLGRTKTNGFRLKLTPNPPWEQVDHLVLCLSPELDIKVLEIHNLLGSITRFTIKGLKAAGPFGKDFFHLQVPEGVKIIEEN